MARHMTFTLALAVALSAVVPGVAGYLSARVEAIEAAERNLHATEVRLNARMERETRQARPVSFPAPCEQGSTIPDSKLPPPAAALAPQLANKPRVRHIRPPVVPPPAWYPEGTAD